jgi:hypothetical protein
MHKNLEQVEFYQAHYRSIYLRAKTKDKKVLRRHLQKLSRQIIQLQNYSTTIQ